MRSIPTNIFRILLGDLSHLASIFILLHKIQTTRSCRGKFLFQFRSCNPVSELLLTYWFFCIGISFKTQALYVGVFLTRYLDLFFHYVSIYNSVMKLFFIGSSCYILYLMKVKYRSAAGCIHTPHTPIHSDLSMFQTNAWPVHRHLQDRIYPRSLPHPFPPLQLQVLFCRNFVVIFHLAGGGGYSPSIVHASTHGGSRDDHDALFGCIGSIPSSLHS